MVLCSVCALKITVVHTQAWLCKWETTIVARTDFQPIKTLLEGGGQEFFFLSLNISNFLPELWTLPLKCC